MVCLILTMTATAKPKPQPAPDNGSWEIITWENGPAMTIVKFFDDHQRLIYEEHLDGVRLDGNSRRVHRKLNKSLRTALIAWENNRHPTRDQGLVATLFR